MKHSALALCFPTKLKSNIEHADPETYGRIVQNFAHWDDIDIHFRNQHFALEDMVSPVSRENVYCNSSLTAVKRSA